MAAGAIGITPTGRINRKRPAPAGRLTQVLKDRALLEPGRIIGSIRSDSPGSGLKI